MMTSKHSPFLQSRVWALPALIVLVMLCACAGRKQERSLLPSAVRCRPGDVVLRRGIGLTSRAVLMADGARDYSHCGIVAEMDGRLVIVHAVPGEPDFEGDSDRVKAEPADRFFSSVRCVKGCLLRPDDASAAQRSAREAVRLFRKGVAFDHDYDDSDTTRLYCSELVTYVYRLAGITLLYGRRHDVRLPGLSLDGVVFPSDFLRSPHLRRVADF